jgi:hypothetical protein
MSMVNILARDNSNLGTNRVNFFNNNNLFNLSSFTLSEANYRLTTWLSRYSPFLFFTYNYISFIVLNYLFFTMSKYFPKFCTCVLFVIFNIFL